MIEVINGYEGFEDLLPEFGDVIEDAIFTAAEFKKLDLDGKELSVVICGDEKIQQLNKDFRKMDKPTNVLSFETEDETMLGDIVISVDTLLRECEEQDKAFKSHFVHLLVHGFLHLLGADHIDEEEAEEMEAQEVEILSSLGVENPYA